MSATATIAVPIPATLQWNGGSSPFHEIAHFRQGSIKVAEAGGQFSWDLTHFDGRHSRGTSPTVQEAKQSAWNVFARELLERWIGQEVD